MSVSMNERALGRVEAMVADADALGISVRTLDSGARVVDCGGGGLEAGLGFAAVCMGGLGRIDRSGCPALRVMQQYAVVVGSAAKQADFRGHELGSFGTLQ